MQSRANAFVRGKVRLAACLLGFAALALSSSALASEVIYSGVTFAYTNAAVSTVGSDLVFVFSNSAQRGFLSLPCRVTASALAVGGGGAGGTSAGGPGAGGGAGGYVVASGLDLPYGDYVVNVGAGGIATASVGGNGGASWFTNVTAGAGYIEPAVGGGGGGSREVNGGAGAVGGSGGGAVCAASKQSVAGGAGLAGQGNDGGTTTAEKKNRHPYGCGGGGAGSVGKSNTAEDLGAAGDGVTNEITGVAVEYARGGAGNWNSVGNGAAGADGVGEGGAGAGNSSTDSSHVGGNGGSGVVVIRISAVFDTNVQPVAMPEGFTDVGGVWQAVYDGTVRTLGTVSTAGYALSGTASASDAGEYQLTVTLDPGYEWADDHTTAPRTYNWAITKAENSIVSLAIEGWRVGATPNAPSCTVAYGTPTYDYSPAGSEVWTAEPPNAAPGTYVCRAIVAEGANWSACTGTVSYSLFYEQVDVPTMPAGFTDVEGVWTVEWDGTERFACSVAPGGFDILPGGFTNAVAAGEYSFTMSPKAGYEWADDHTTAPRTYNWAITKASNYVRDLMIEGWRENQMPHAPTCTVRYGTPVYTYRNDALEDVEENWQSAVPTSEGVYWVRAKVEETGDFQGGEARRQFTIWADPANKFTDWVEITVPPSEHAGAIPTDPMVNLPVKVKLSPQTVPGFEYDRCMSGNNVELRFYAQNQDCTLLPFEVAILNSVGESEFWVRVPELWRTGTVIRACWHLRAGETAPGNDPTLVWSDWSRSDAETATAFYDDGVFGLVNREGRWVNYFTVPPAVTPDSWLASDGATAHGVMTPGELKVAEETRTFYRDAYSGELFEEMPTTVVSVYEVISEIVDTEAYWPVASTNEFRIGDYRPETDIGDGEGFSGRVLLFNNDSNAEGPINYQGPADVYSQRPTWWTNTSEEVSFSSPLYPALKAGTGFELRRIGVRGLTLWKLTECRLGNTYRASDIASATLDGHNYLPWSATSYDINRTGRGSRDLVGSNPLKTGICVMRNVAGAALESCVYSNGVGTVYFDAVNQIARDGRGDATAFRAGYTLKVEASTNGVDWFAVPVTALRRDYASSWVDERPFRRVSQGLGVGEVALDIVNGGTTGNFYRVYAEVKCYEPAKVRITRVASDPGYSVEDPDEGGFILLDNVIVSPPSADAHLEPSVWSSPFPATGETVYPKATLVSHTNAFTGAASSAESVESAKMFYRWRYLDQKALPAFGCEWMVARLNPRDDFKALDAITLPVTPGDIEFYFEGVLAGEFYRYVDYTGLGLGTPGYSENAAAFVDGKPDLSADAEKKVHSLFPAVRTREGKSEHEAIELLYRFNGGAVKSVPMTVTDDYAWRGFIPTLTNSLPRLEYRIVAHNHQTVGSYTWETNTTYWGDAITTNNVPVSSTLAEVSEGQWSMVTNDHATGYLMVQIDDRSRGLTVVHADYQNFNTWNDAKGDYFVGRSDSYNSGKPMSGVAPTQRTFVEDYETWLDMPPTNQHWTCTFPDELEFGGAAYPGYEVFNSEIYNGWVLGRGMWVSESYRDAGRGAAYQMEGRGVGYAEYTDSPNPRGIETISFDARLGQPLDFDGFVYYDAGARERKSMTNYAFVARIAYDENMNSNFSGNASISLVAHYQPARGCYEARLETVKSPLANTKNCQVLSLYKWMADANGRMTATRLYYWTNSYDRVRGIQSADRLHQNFTALFISTKTDDTSVEVRIGVTTNSNLTAIGDTMLETGVSAFNYTFTDSDADRFVNGTYGFQIANCPGSVVRPICFTEAVTNAYTGGAKGKIEKISFSGQKTISGEAFSETPSENTFSDYWYYENGQVVPFAEGDAGKYWGMRIDPNLRQTVDIYTRALSLAEHSYAWELLTNVVVGTYGSAGAMEHFEIPLYTTDNVQVRVRAGGSAADVKTDVVVDNIVVRQWRGDDWGNAANYVGGGIGGWDRLGFTNFTFSTAWIKDHGMLLSAKRTVQTKPSSIRGPLCDGTGYTTGTLGLGRFTFAFTNAQKNAELELQIATNINYTSASADALDVFDTNKWVTVTNFTFAAEGEESGSRTVYVGLHGVEGMFRLVVPSNLVARVAGETDPSRFGEILITDVSCSDEPELDKTAWWGWNLRAVGEDAAGRDRDTNPYFDNGAQLGRTYLYDNGIRGLSMALNNSVIDPRAQASLDGKTLPTDEAGIAEVEEEFRAHLPFLQTPTFARQIVGEVTFKARKFSPADRNAFVHLFGARDGSSLDTDDTTWNYLQTWEITADTYTKVETWKAPPNNNYTAFRLVVTGVPECPSVPHAVDQPARVILDEVIVCEAVRPAMAFRNVGVFRSNTSGLEMVPGVPSVAEQPLCNEGWGVQCEVYASQLSEEIDYEMTPPEVYLSYYRGRNNWGYENWGPLIPSSQRVKLRRASDTEDLVFRSSHQGSEDSCVPMSTEAETVQYMLEVVYHLKSDPLTPVTNVLTKGNWSVPEWYKPLDFNNDPKYGKGSSFAAFNVLDTVAPGWAWINEVNLMSAYDREFRNTDRLQQWIEVAAPSWASLKGWEIRFLYNGSATVDTRTVAVFGSDDLPATKAAPVYSNMVFHVVANNHKAVDIGALNPAKGEVDGFWKFNVTGGHFCLDWEVDASEPTGIQLVRASGIVEQEIVVAGTNVWEGFTDEYDPEYVARELNRRLDGCSFISAGRDDRGGTNTLSVLERNGSSTNDWHAAVPRTPGKVNFGQIINTDDMPTPNGEELIIYANLDPSMPHIRQSFGDMAPTNTSLTLAIRKGTVNGTNIVYTIDPWYTIGTVNCQTGRHSWTLSPIASTARTWTFQIGAGLSNNVTLNASAAISPALLEAGLDPEDKYTPAVMDWLEKHQDVDGNLWANPEAEEVSLAKLVSIQSESVITNLTLKEMYWLDIDPTKSNMYLRAGIKNFALKDGGDPAGPNRVLDVYLAISNDAPPYAYYPPQVLRGLEPGSHSKDYSKTSGTPWKGATFKVTGVLQNGHTDLRPHSANYLGLRWFVFNPDSFYPVGHERECQSRIEILCPYSVSSPGANAGWDVQRDSSGNPFPVLNAFSIDESIVPTGVEPLNKESELSHE